MAGFNNDKRFSLITARKFIYPVLQNIFGKTANIDSIEEEENNVARIFDSAGIDLTVTKDNVTFGVNSRCFNDKGFKPTFTIRQTRHGRPVEYYRIKAAIQHGGLYPKYFAQCYSTDDSAIVGIIETEKLFDFIAADEGVKNPKVAKRTKEDVNFLSIEWQHLKSMETYKVKGNKVDKLK